MFLDFKRVSSTRFLLLFHTHIHRKIQAPIGNGHLSAYRIHNARCSLTNGSYGRFLSFHQISMPVVVSLGIFFHFDALMLLYVRNCRHGNYYFYMFYFDRILFEVTCLVSRRKHNSNSFHRILFAT